MQRAIALKGGREGRHILIIRAPERAGAWGISSPPAEASVASRRGVRPQATGNRTTSIKGGRYGKGT